MFYSDSSRLGLLTRLGCVQGLHFSDLVSGNLDALLWFLASGSFLAAPPLISNCLSLPCGTQRRSWRLDPLPYKQENGEQKDFCAQGPHRVLLVFSFNKCCLECMLLCVFQVDQCLFTNKITYY